MHGRNPWIKGGVQVLHSPGHWFVARLYGRLRKIGKPSGHPPFLVNTANGKAKGHTCLTLRFLIRANMLCCPDDPVVSRARGPSLAVNGDTMLIDLDGNAALTLLIIEIPKTSGDNSQQDDDQKQGCLVHGCNPAQNRNVAGGDEWPASDRPGLRAHLRVTDRILDAADSILDLSIQLFALPFGRQLGIANSFANRCLDLPFDAFCRPDHTIFVHAAVPVERSLTASTGGVQQLSGFKPLGADTG
jgi:hypothetical protein